MKYRISTAFCAITAIVGLTGTARAQDPGTNVPTAPPPPPSTSPGLPSDPAPATPPVTSTSPVITEPVIDASTTRRTLPNRPLLVTGTLVLGASYGAAVIVAATSDRAADDKLYYPVAGPWMDLAHRGCADNPCDNNTWDRILIAGDGVLQGIGALGMVLSLVIPEKTTHNWYLIGNRDLIVLPRLGGGVAGLGAVGRF